MEKSVSFDGKMSIVSADLFIPEQVSEENQMTCENTFNEWLIDCIIRECVPSNLKKGNKLKSLTQNKDSAITEKQQNSTNDAVYGDINTPCGALAYKGTEETQDDTGLCINSKEKSPAFNSLSIQNLACEKCQSGGLEVREEEIPLNIFCDNAGEGIETSDLAADVESIESDSDESEDTRLQDTSMEMHTSILHNVIEPEPFAFTNFSDLKSKLRSRNLLPYSQFPLTQKPKVNDNTKTYTENIFKEEKISAAANSKGVPLSLQYQSDDSENNEVEIMETVVKSENCLDNQTDDVNGNEGEEEHVEATQFEGNLHSFLGLAVPTFSNKVPRIGLCKSDKVKRLHTNIANKKNGVKTISKVSTKSVKKYDSWGELEE